MTLAGYSEDQFDIQKLARDLFGSLATTEAARQVDAPGCFGAHWSRLVQESGLAGLAVPESDGGAGMSTAALFVVAEECGRALFSGPYLSTCLLVLPLLTDCVDGEEELVASLAAGVLTATFGCSVTEASWSTPGTGGLTLSADGTVRGTVYQVPDATTADLLVAPAASSTGTHLVVVDLRHAGVQRADVPQIDTTLRSGTVTLDTVPARILQLSDWGAQAAVDRTVALGRLGTAAAQVGGARRLVELAVDYVGQRQQFGRPVGAFQAVKHLCADSAVRLETHWAAVAALVRSLDQQAPAGPPHPGDRVDLPGAAALVKASVSEAYRDIARDVLHLHGGIGFTWEHDCHLYFKNAQATAVAFGSPAELRAELAARALVEDLFATVIRPTAHSDGAFSATRTSM